MSGWRGDDGFATVLGAFAVAALAVTVVAVGYTGAAALARHRAQSAADLSALAAAAQSVLGAPDPCATARRSVARQRSGARVERCAVVASDVVVSVAVPVELGPFGLRTATESARAGPEE